MGFSSALQGSTSHDAILARVDAELRLLENMRRCLSAKIKADRDYSIGLHSFVMQSQKFDAGNHVQAGSHVAKAWAVFVDETERIAKVVKDNADTLATSTMDKLTALYAEKKANRKQHQDEYARNYAELNRLQELVMRTRVDYERCLEAFVSAKAKYDEQKVRGDQSAKLRDRYQKAARKLHATHNDYVLLLCEASEFERDLRTILLPGLLEYRQAVQEDMIDKWRLAMREVADMCSRSSTAFIDQQAKIDKSVDAIKAADEYTAFIDRFRTNPPDPVAFRFDDNLLKAASGYLGSSVKTPSGLCVNDLTVDSLRQRLNDLESMLAECRSQITDKQTAILQQDTEIQTVKFKSDPASVARMFSVKKSMDGLKKDVNELRCVEQKLSKQRDLIHKPIQDLGCEQPPAGCDVTSQPNDVITDDVTAKRRILSTAPAISMLKKPFSNNTMPKRIQPSPTDPIPPSTPSPTPPVVNNGNSVDEMFGSGGKSLEEELWFHGVLPRGEVVRLLATDGDFLVRETMRNDEKQIVLSVMWTSPKHFIVQTSPEGHFRFEGPSFRTVQELIGHQFRSGAPVTSRSGAILKSPVAREDWELNNDDVQLIEKIGRGNFGDVYKANLRAKNSSTRSVAVKTCKVTLPEEQKKKFLQEGRILKQYDHPNIVRFIGICVQKQPIMIVMELVPGGSLLNYLRNSGNNLAAPKAYLGMCLDAAAGMQYLESKNCIHRDLAARNCLVGEKNIVKISDFGMSREEEEYTVSDGLKQIPIKWTAPEALNYGKYTSLCDVWSFGVLCWEIFSRGGTPYQGMTNSRAREMLDSGYRMPAPEGTPEDMYQLMLKCWNYEADSRPHFDEIHAAIDLIYSGLSVGPETRV